MFELNNFDKIDLTIINGKIVSYVDVTTSAEIKSFPQRLKAFKVPKLYVLKENGAFLYVGTTSQSLVTRNRYGLSANGIKGYHGYKLKSKERVQLYVWCFADLTTIQIENIEAELAFCIRKETGQWPLAQNEIHFNNNYPEGQKIAEELFKRCSSNTFQNKI